MAVNRVKKRNNKENQGRIDIVFLSLVLILVTIGLVMLFSASYAFSLEQYGNSYKFISRQAIFAVIGIAVLLLAQFAVMASAKENANIWILVFIPAASRCCSALAVTVLKPMQTSQYAKRKASALATFGMRTAPTAIFRR